MRKGDWILARQSSVRPWWGDDHQERSYVQRGGVSCTANCRRRPQAVRGVRWPLQRPGSLLNPTCKGRSTLSAAGVEDTALTTALVGQYGQIKASPNPERSPCAHAAGQRGVLRPPFLPCQSQGQRLPQEAVEIGNRGAGLDILSSSSGSPVDCKFEFVLK